MRSKIYCCMGTACLSVRIPNRNSRCSYEGNFKRELFAMVQTEYMEITKEKTNSQEFGSPEQNCPRLEEEGYVEMPH